MAVSELKKFLPCLLKVLVGLGVVLGGLGVVALILWLPPWQAEHVRGRLDKPADEYRLATLEDEHRRTLAQILTGGGLLVGLYLGWRRVRAAEEGQITDRFTKAIEQLGQEGEGNMAIRLGGIYALERIAKDSEKDHGPIMEVLTAYVRENAPKTGAYVLKAVAKPTTDIQAILTVLGRRETTGKNRVNDRLDLSNTHLAGVVIRDGNLSEANLILANLSGALLIGANLSGATLGWGATTKTGLMVADLFGANLSGATLNRANLSGATLLGADLTRTFLVYAENLTAQQVQSAENWRKAYLPEDLQYLKNLPDEPA